MLVNNAGISSAPGSRFRSPVDEIAENIRAVYETNVFGVVRVTNAFMPLLRESEASRIVNLTSKRGSIGEEGAWVGRPYMSYSTSKTALNAIRERPWFYGWLNWTAMDRQEWSSKTIANSHGNFSFIGRRCITHGFGPPLIRLRIRGSTRFAR